MSSSEVPNASDAPVRDLGRPGSAGVTVYVIDAQAILDAENPVYQAITALADTVNRVAQDLSLVVIARKSNEGRVFGQ